MHENEFQKLFLLALERIMADLTALNAAVAANTAAVADVQAVVAGLQTSTDQAGVDAATAQITTNNAALEALKTPPAAT
jgi:hypothetical protein